MRRQTQAFAPAADFRTVPETPDWKQKYRDSVREMESEEKRWRHVETALRRLVSRLCVAGMGTSGPLDDELSRIADANRRKAEVEELESLAKNLTRKVVAVEAQTQRLASVETGQPDSATRAAVRALLGRLAADDATNPVVKALTADLVAAKTNTTLADVLLRIADLVHERGESIARERLAAAAVLADVGKRLEEMLDYFAAAAEESRTTREATVSFDAAVTAQVLDLSVEFQAATELHALQSLVGRGLESVTRYVHDFRRQAEDRLTEQTAQTEAMCARVATLEQETRELHGRLADERDRARVDSLTNVANRKAFDERLAQELARMRHSAAPVTLLVWDVDNFKSINDVYGHRAGDRVLQSVAQCFATGIRSTDFIARIGGEEFAMIMIGLPLDAAIAMANDLRVAVEALRFHFRGKPICVTASCGITEIQEREAAESVFDRADAALYRAKDAGRNACVAV
jgi:diguanylate cyclase